jgi:hypothetical protein
MILFFLYIFLSRFPNLYYFFVQIAFFFSKFYIEFKETMEREFTLIVVLGTRYDDFLIYIVH